MDRIAIIGTGLIGSSLGLAIKRVGAKDLEVVGHDREPTAASKAQKRGAIDRTCWNIVDAVRNARMVIIATPVLAIREVMERIAPHLPEGCVVTDTGSTKAAVMEWASSILPEWTSFIGGHPMAGKEVSGPEGAEASLFEGKTYCLIPGKGAREEAVKAVVSLVTAIGAKPHFIDPVEHDSYVAAISHLPMFLSVALVGCTSKSPSWGEMAQVASTGYRDLTRLASGDPVMHRDIALTNARAIVHWIDTFIKELYGLRKQLLEIGDDPHAWLVQQSQSQSSEKGGKVNLDPISSVFVQAWDTREKWLAGKVTPGGRGEPGMELPGFGERMGELIFGRRLMEVHKRLLEDMQRKEKGKRPPVG